MTQMLEKHHWLRTAYSSSQYCLHIVLSQFKLVNKFGNLINSIAISINIRNKITIPSRS